MHNVTHRSFDGCNRSVIHFRLEMPASRLWKKLHEDMEKMFTLWTSMLFPPGKTKMWTQCIVCLHIATFIDPGSWTEKTGRDLECFPQQCSGNSCGIYMLMYALSTCTSCPLTFTEEEVPVIRKWWCIQLMESFCLEGHGQRFAHWTEEASQLLQGTLEPVFRVSKSTTTKQSPSRRVVVEEDTDKVQQPTIVRDIHTAWYWVQNNKDLFCGEVTEPAFLQMNSDDQQNALRKALSSEFPEAKDDFLFIFQSQDDMETFLSYCVDKQGLKVNVMFLNQ